MKSSPATRSRRLKSSLLLGVCSFWGLGTAFPAFSQEEEGADRSQLPIPRESRPVHSRSAETARNASTAEQGDSQSGQGGQPSSLTLKAGASYTVPRGTAMSLKVTSVPSNGMRLLQKDLEGNPVPARINDVISAMITEDIYVDGDRVIPEGTVFRGRVKHVNGPRRVQRPGWVDIAFDELELPNHKIFRFRAEADNLEASTMRSKISAAKMIAANAAGGAIVGTLAAYQVFGMHYTVACKGINLGAGAAAGALLAGGHAIMKRGHAAWLEPGDGLNLSIDTDMVMPALTAPTKHVSAAATNLAGVSIDVLKAKIVKSGIGGQLIRLDVNINNDSDVTLHASDLYLRDSTGTEGPLIGGPEIDDDSAFLFQLQPNDSLRSRIYFDVEHPKLPHEFIWYHHERRKKVCFRQKLEL